MDKLYNNTNNIRLFDRLPDGFFAPLSRKYKAVYAYALITLYQCLKIYKTSITRSAYMDMLRKNGQDIMMLFSIDNDIDDDRELDEQVDIKEVASGDKFSYVVRKLSKCGWFRIDRDVKTGVDYVYLPSYSIRVLELLDSITSDISTYLPLVHQTYSELKLEDEKEDEYMFRSLANAVHNSYELELSVTLLHHSIIVFNHKLTGVFNPNDVLKQHFDDYKSEVGDAIYHPMKTYDSFGLYSRPTIEILNRWLRDERIMAKLASQARIDTNHSSLSVSESIDLVVSYINKVIDVFNRLNKSFDQIDRANADYTEAVQKKVNYLSGSDKSLKGKLDKIISSLADELHKNSSLDEESSPLLAKMVDTVELNRASIFDDRSPLMPFRRGTKEEVDPMDLAPDISDNDDDLMNDFLNNEVSAFSEAAIESFMRQAFGTKKEINTNEIALATDDDLVLLIMALVRAEFNTMFFTMEKIGEKTMNGHFQIPEYILRKRGE